MQINKVIIIFLFFISGIGCAQQVILKGKDPAYAGQELIFYRHSDPVTLIEIPLCSAKISDDGLFFCSFHVSEIILVSVHIGVYNGSLLVEPGKTYDLVFPPPEWKSETDKINPYFTEVGFRFTAKNTDSLELNQVMSRFDNRFDDMIIRLSQVLSMRRMNQVLEDSVLQSIRNEFEYCKNPYFQNYLNYRLGLFQQMGSLRKEKDLVLKYFAGKPVDFNQIAYCDLFNEVFGDFFQTFGQTREGKNLAECIDGYKSYKGLFNTIKSYPAPISDTLTDWIILKNLNEQIYQNSFRPADLIQVLDSLVDQTKHIFAREWANNIKKEACLLMTGYPVPVVPLIDQGGKTSTLEHYRGKYLLISFVASWSTASLLDLDLLKKIRDQFNQNLEVILVCPNSDFSGFNEIVSRKKSTLPLFYTSSDPELPVIYKIKSYPTYFLIDPYGKFLASPAPGPQENFMGFFQGVLKRRN